MLTIDHRKMTVPGGGVYRGDGGSWFRRILVPVRAPGQAYPALAMAARICGMTGGVLRLVHVRTCDPPLPIVGRIYLATAGEATAVLEETLLAAWACGSRRPPPSWWMPGAAMWPPRSRGRRPRGQRT